MSELTATKFLNLFVSISIKHNMDMQPYPIDTAGQTQSDTLDHFDLAIFWGSGSTITINNDSSFLVT